MLAVSEIFGPTVQGEGPSLGKQATFLRLAGCNLTCTWCDTKYTWDWEHYDKAKEVKLRSVIDVGEELLTHNTPLLVITGGEPLLQQREIVKLAALDLFPRIEFETNGTIIPDTELRWRKNVHFNVSPKLANAGGVPDFNGCSTLAVHDRAIFKFVCQSEEDFIEIEQIMEICKIPRSKVWIMPEGVSREALERRLVLGRLADAAVQRGFNVTTRLHVMIWGNTRAK